MSKNFCSGAEPSRDIMEPHQERMIRLQLLNMERKRVLAKAKELKSDLKELEKLRGGLRSRKDMEEMRRYSILPGMQELIVSAPDAAGVSDGWIWPEFRIAEAWRRWFSQSKQARFDPSFAIRGDRPRIAFIVTGGFGDILKASTLFAPLSNKFNADIHAFADNEGPIEILRHHPYVKSINVIHANPFDFSKQSMNLIPIFDLVVTWTYFVSYVMPPCSRLDNAENKLFFQESDKLSEPYKIYFAECYVWPAFNNGFGRDLIDNNQHVIDVGSVTSGLSVNPAQSILFRPEHKALAVTQPHRGRPYVTVHHGVNPNGLPEKTRPTTYGSTKNISVERWAEIVADITALGLDVIQLGNALEARIPGVKYIYNGLTDMSETAILIKSAVCHIDTEGGLVHLAKAVHTKSIVLFGPTPVKVFGYQQNTNLEPNGCRACWYSTVNWGVQCPRETSGPDCMESHRSSDVLSSVLDILNAREDIKIELLASGQRDDESALAVGNMRLKVEGILSNFDRDTLSTEAILDWSAGEINKIIIIADEIADIQDLTKKFGISDKSFDVILTRDLIAADNDLSLKYQFTHLVASPYNLPHETCSVDLVIASIQAWNDTESGLLILEICRVLKNQGILLGIPSPCERAFNLNYVLHSAGLSLTDNYSLLDDNTFNFALRVGRSKAPGSVFTGKSVNFDKEKTKNAPHVKAINFIERLDQDIAVQKAAIKSNLKEIYGIVNQHEKLKNEIVALRDDILKLRGADQGWIEFSSDALGGDIVSLLGDSWHGSESWGVWGSGSRHTLSLFVPQGVDINSSIEVEFVFNLVPLPIERPRIVVIRIGEFDIARVNYSGPNTVGYFVVPYQNLTCGGATIVEFDVGGSIMPSVVMANSTDDRSLGLGLIRLRYRIV